jgi:hypothetical protein
MSPHRSPPNDFPRRCVSFVLLTLTILSMPTAADIEKAAKRVQSGTDVIGTILKMKKQTRNAINTGVVSKLKESGFTIFPFDASTL